MGTLAWAMENTGHDMKYVSSNGSMGTAVHQM